MSVDVQPQIGFRICIKALVILFHVSDQTFKAVSLHRGRKEEILSGRSELGKLKDDDILVLMLLRIHMPAVCLCTLDDFFYNLVLVRMVIDVCVSRGTRLIAPRLTFFFNVQIWLRAVASGSPASSLTA